MPDNGLHALSGVQVKEDFSMTWIVRERQTVLLSVCLSARKEKYELPILPEKMLSGKPICAHVESVYPFLRPSVLFILPLQRRER